MTIDEETRRHNIYVDRTIDHENYSMKEIKNLLVVLKINLTTIEIADVMKKINNMLYDKNIIKYDDFTYKDNGYKKTLMTQSHNTSNGISNKFVYHKDNTFILELIFGGLFSLYLIHYSLENYSLNIYNILQNI